VTVEERLSSKHRVTSKDCGGYAYTLLWRRGTRENVRKGEKACPVVCWKRLAIQDKETGEEEKVRRA
jgi:hypothetical protein